MHAVIRSYSGPGASALFDRLEASQGEVEQMMRGIPGFRSYTLVRIGDGGTAISICDDQAATDRSTALASDWVQRQGLNPGVAAPTVAEGDVILNAG